MQTDASIAPSPHPILYTFRRCPFAIRARMALYGAKLEGIELREVALRNKPQAMLELSPKGTVPVLALDAGKHVLDESWDIILWAANQGPTSSEAALWLKQEHRQDAAQQAALRSHMEGPFKQALDRAKYGSRYPGEDPKAHYALAQNLLHTLEQSFAQNLRQAYLTGAQPSLTDVAIFPLIRQFAAIDPDTFAKQQPRLKAWLDLWLATPAFARIMDKATPWQPGDAPIWSNRWYAAVQ